MLLGGVTIEERRVHQLARIVEEPLGAKLEHALRFRASVVGVTSDERAKILKALENAPDLQEVRELLLADEKWRPNRRLA